MIKYVFFYTVLNVLILWGCDNSTRIPLKRINYVIEFKPGVKSIKEYNCDQYWINKTPPQIVKSSCKLSCYKEYTKEGYLTKELKWFNLDYPNTPGMTKTIKYNELGQIIEEYTNWHGSINQESKIIHSYNANGFEIERIIFDDGVITFREETEYDEYNCSIKKTFYRGGNQLIQSMISEFDNKNREIIRETYDGNNKLMYRGEYEYGVGDEHIIYRKFNSDGKMITENDKRESLKNNKIEAIYSNRLPDKDHKDVEYYSNGKVRTWHYKNQNGEDIHQVYDENQRIIERKISSNGEWKDTFTWKYREDGVVLEESESTSRYLGISYFKKTTYYKYDLKNNWIEKVTVDTEGNAIELNMREIEYIEV
jgi:hypothetical protein